MKATVKSIVSKNVNVAGAAHNIRFTRTVNDEGVKTVVKARGLPKLILRSDGNGFIGHQAGKRKTPDVTAKTEVKAYTKMVKAVWNAH